MDFGLGLVLSLTDNATAGLNNAVNSLNTLTQVAENASQSLNSLASLSAFSAVSNQIGGSFIKAGGSILGVFTTLLGKVQQTGSEFESFRMTLNNLYGDSQKAENAISQLLDFSIKSPFEVGEVKDMLIVLQSQGIDAFENITNSITGARQETLSWIADLMAFKPDVQTERWKLAITNYLGSGDTRALRNVLDMGKIDEILGHDIGDTTEERMNDLVEIVEKKNLYGLADNLSHTWQGVASNISDAFTKIYKSIADNGVFDKLKASFMGLSGAILSLDNDQLEALGKTLAEALNIIVTPITYISEKLNNLINSIINLCQTNPEIVKLGVVITAIVGALVVLAGISLKFMSALGMVSIGLTTFSTSFKAVSGLLKSGSLKILSSLIPLTAALGLMYLAWKSDFMGIKTNVSYFVSNVTSAFRTAKEAVNGSLSDMLVKLFELRRQDDFFSNLTIGAMKLMMVFKALYDAWGDYTLSEDNYLKAKELGILPLIEAILDLKYRFGLFKDGFIAGWKEIMDTFSSIGKSISTAFKGTVISSFIDTITGFFQKLSDNDADAWYDFGNSFAKFASTALIFIAAIKGISIIVSIGTKIALVFKNITMLMNGTLTAVTFLGKAFSVLGTAITTVFRGILTVASLIGKAFSVLGTAITTVIKFFTSFAGGVTLAITGAVLAVTSFVDMWKNGFSKVKAVLTVLGTTLAGVGLVLAGIAAWPTIIVAALVGALAVSVVYIKDHLEQIKEFFSSVGDWCVEVFNNAFDKVKNFFSSLGSFFSSAWDSIKSVFSTIGTAIADAVSGAVKGAINSVLSGAASIINGFISAINVAIGVLNAVPGIKISKLSKLEVPKLALGGIIDDPTLSVVGEEGREAVMPLENNTGWMSSLAGMIAEQVSELRPSNTNIITPSNTSGGQRYVSTNNSTSQTYEGDTDNSVVFNEGAIQIIVQQATEAEARKLAMMVMALIKRQRELDSMLRYN